MLAGNGEKMEKYAITWQHNYHRASIHLAMYGLHDFYNRTVVYANFCKSNSYSKRLLNSWVFFVCLFVCLFFFSFPRLSFFYFIIFLVLKSVITH